MTRQIVKPPACLPCPQRLIGILPVMLASIGQESTCYRQIGLAETRHRTVCQPLDRIFSGLRTTKNSGFSAAYL
jgi:hypothetical protein